VYRIVLIGIILLISLTSFPDFSHVIPLVLQKRFLPIMISGKTFVSSRLIQRIPAVNSKFF
jgi:hypothetical protein